MDRLHKWLWLTVKCNITLAKVRNLIDYFGDIDKVYSAKPNEYLKLNFLIESAIFVLVSPNNAIFFTFFGNFLNNSSKSYPLSDPPNIKLISELKLLQATIQLEILVALLSL